MNMRKRLIQAAAKAMHGQGYAADAVDAILETLASPDARPLDHAGAEALLDREHGPAASPAKEAAREGIDYRYKLGAAQTVRVAMINHVREGK